MNLLTTNPFDDDNLREECPVFGIFRTSEAATNTALGPPALKQIEGAYSLVCVADDTLIGVRDPFGIRQLVIGKQGDSYVLASELSAKRVSHGTGL